MRVNIYIRKSNEDKWNALVDKSDWVNSLLSEPIGGSSLRSEPKTQKPLNKETKDYSLCSHKQIKGFCKHGCK